MRDQDIKLFVERGMRGGILMISKRYAKASNPLVEGYDTSKPTNDITYLEANNLYRWAMSLPLPKSGFKWRRVMPTEEQIIKIKEHSKKGWILELDLEHNAQNSYPLAPEKNVICKKGADVRLPKAYDGRSECGLGEQQHAGADPTRDIA